MLMINAMKRLPSSKIGLFVCCNLSALSRNKFFHYFTHKGFTLSLRPTLTIQILICHEGKNEFA